MFLNKSNSTRESAISSTFENKSEQVYWSALTIYHDSEFTPQGSLDYFVSIFL